MLYNRNVIARLDRAVADSRVLDRLGYVLDGLPAWMVDGRLTWAVVTMTVRYVSYHLGCPESLTDALSRDALAALPRDLTMARWGGGAARWLVGTLTNHGLMLWAARVRASDGLPA